MAVLLQSVNAAAQDLPFSPTDTLACIEGAQGTERQGCIGLAANACMEAPSGYTTVGMMICLGSEIDYWDARLNTAYSALFALHRDADAEAVAGGWRPTGEADALRDMQRAWIGYRDAACTYEQAGWGGGSGGGPSTAACMMHMTARQALTLEDRLQDQGGR